MEILKKLSYFWVVFMLLTVLMTSTLNFSVKAYRCYFCSGSGKVTRRDSVEVVCNTCSGRGTISKKDNTKLRCMRCGSSSVSVEFVPTGFGGYGEKRQCLSCRSYDVSYGYVETSTCNSCWGDGRTTQTVNKTVNCDHCRGSGYVKYHQSKAKQPVVKEQGENFVVLVNNSNMEYSLDGSNWQDSSTFNNLSPNVVYKFYQRYKGNIDYYVGESSDPLVVILHSHNYINSCDDSCEECDYIRTINHIYSKATCTKPKTCKVCGKMSGQALGHSYDSGKVTKKATCKSTGVKTYTCKVCKKTKTSTITKSKKHTYTNSCDKTCNICKATRKTTHKYDSGKVTKKATCKSTGIKTYTCKVCKKTKTSTIAKSKKHTYTNSCDKTCNVCKIKRKTSHKYTNDCDKKCNVCNATRKIKHKYSNSCDTYCNICKYKRSITHKYSNSKDKTCNVCKKVRCIHKYVSKTVKATTAKNGYVLTECTYCDKDKSKTVIYSAKNIKLSKTSYTFDETVKTPNVIIKDSKGKTIPQKYYSISYQSGRKKAGKYKVTVRFKGKYSGTKTLYFEINNLTAKEKFFKYCNYKIYKGRVIIESIDTSIKGSLVIPSEIKGYPVSEIGFNAFNNAYLLTSVTIPDSIEKIYYYSFEFCNSLVNINVNSKNKYYSSVDGVLYNKRKTEIIRYPTGKNVKKFVIPSTVTVIGNNAFSNCYLEYITIPNSVKKIGDSAFICSNFLKNITIPTGVTEIYDNAFSGCDSITSITIPANVSKIWYNPFSCCASLKKISVSSANKFYTSVDGVLFNKDKTELICYPAGKTNKKYYVPNGVKTISQEAFSNSNSFTEKSLTSIVIPKSVTRIDFCAFTHCNSLKNVYYKGNITQKSKIIIDVGNDYLLSAKWYYDS